MTDKNPKKLTPTLWFAPLISAIVVGLIARIAYGVIIGSQVTPQMQEFGLDAGFSNYIWMYTIFSAVSAAVIALVAVLIIRAVRK